MHATKGTGAGRLWSVVPSLEVLPWEAKWESFIVGGSFTIVSMFNGWDMPIVEVAEKGSSSSLIEEDHITQTRSVSGWVGEEERGGGGGVS